MGARTLPDATPTPLADELVSDGTRCDVALFTVSWKLHGKPGLGTPECSPTPTEEHTGLERRKRRGRQSLPGRVVAECPVLWLPAFTDHLLKMSAPYMCCEKAGITQLMEWEKFPWKLVPEHLGNFQA